MNYKIVNPITNKMNSIKSKLGKELLKKYLLHLRGGAMYTFDRKERQRMQERRQRRERQERGTARNEPSLFGDVPQTPEQVKSIKVVDESTVDPKTIIDAEIVKPEDIVDTENIATASLLEYPHQIGPSKSSTKEEYKVDLNKNTLLILFKNDNYIGLFKNEQNSLTMLQFSTFNEMVTKYNIINKDNIDKITILVTNLDNTSNSFQFSTALTLKQQKADLSLINNVNDFINNLLTIDMTLDEFLKENDECYELTKTDLIDDVIVSTDSTSKETINKIKQALDSKMDNPEEVKPDTPEVNPETPEEVKPDTPQEVKPDTPQEVNPETLEEVKPNTPEEVKPSTPLEVKLETPQELETLEMEDVVNPETSEELKLETPEEKLKTPEELKPETPEVVTPVVKDECCIADNPTEQYICNQYRDSKGICNQKRSM